VRTHVGANVGNSSRYKKKSGPPKGTFRIIKAGNALMISLFID